MDLDTVDKIIFFKRNLCILNFKAQFAFHLLHENLSILLPKWILILGNSLTLPILYFLNVLLACLRVP